MSKVSILILFLSFSAFADDLKTITVKKDTVVPPGYVCYDEPSIKKIDDAQKKGLDCLKALQESKNTIEKLKDEQVITVHNPTHRPLPLYKEKPFQIVAGAVIGLIIGMGIGVSF